MTVNLPPRQPDDPGVAADGGEYAPVRFEDSFAGRQTAWLGEVLIGEVGLNPGGRLQRAHARLDLPHLSRRFWPATSLPAARRIVAREVRQWIARTPLQYVEVGR